MKNDKKLKLWAVIGLFVVAVCVATIGLWGPKSTPSGVGEYTGVGRGNNGDVTVVVKADAEQIYDIQVTEHVETAGLGDKAIEKMIPAIIESQSLNVDTVSGATNSSNAVLTAVRNALESAGFDVSIYDKEVTVTKEKEEDKEYNVDVVVVGAGGAGMSAAIIAADEGKSVLIVESQSMVGGNSIRATGGMNAAATQFQGNNEFSEDAGIEKTLKTAAEEWADHEVITQLAATVRTQYDAYKTNPEGYFDSPELMELDTLIGGHGINDYALVKQLAESSSDAIDWLDSIGATLNSVGFAGGASVKRIHKPLNDEGKVIAVGSYIIPILEKNIEQRDNVEILFETTAEEILTNDEGAAVGIVAAGETGNTITVNAKSVVLATGGFGANHEMVESYRPELKGFMTTNADGAQGQGIIMAQQIGADTVDMDQIQIHPTVEYNSAHLITEGLRGDGAILVNVNGERFYDECLTRDKVSAAVIAQPESYAWLIIDQSMVDASAVIQGYIDSGYTFKGQDGKELGEQIGVDGETLQNTIDTWNTYVENKEDPDFNRTSFTDPLDQAPYYAIKITPGIHHTMGGLHINTEAEVLNEEGEVIAGLFACGEVTGGVHGGNRLGGTAVSDFVVYGRIAGQSAADYAD